ncbi:pentapeptide repeat-containing protein [Actinomadura geliboluensis]|uniref:pentapeptide repeat-containing protein n=1 Tax=Actinomadura geliboluensis TaxID=882440 RepID=UPI00372386E5
MQRPRVREVVATVLALAVLAATWGAVQWAPAGPARWTLAGAAVVGAAVLALWGLLVPGARRLAGETSELTAGERARLTPAERVEAVNNARQALMQSVTGLVVIVGVVFTAAGLLYTARTLDVTRQGQITDRYTKAIEQLGSGKPEVRMGGIYSLERLMNDSDRPQDRRTITEVLAAYIRSHAQDKPPIGSDKTRLAVDVQSALTVLGRARPSHGLVVDLRNTDLHRKNLSGMTLNGVDLSEANLSGANLQDARLSHAVLCNAHLVDANLIGAKLVGADAYHALLTDANLSNADLTDADLSFADLRRVSTTLGTNLLHTNLNAADLRFRDGGLTEEEIRKFASPSGLTMF